MAFFDLNAPTAALRVCVDFAQPGHFSGRVYGQRLTEPMVFSDLGALLLRLDEVLDKQNFPQAFQRGRTFSDKVKPVPAAEHPDQGLSPDAVSAARGEAATFEIYVTSRRSASWQGRVDWLDGGKGCSFDSALELVKLLEARIR